MCKKYLITCAFPYSNGSIHLGHILEHVQADILVRFKKFNKENVYFICSDDSHGTPIMIKSEKLKLNPLDFIKHNFIEHKNDLKNFSIEYDNYHITHSSENARLVIKLFNILNNKGYIKEKTVFQLYDNNKSMFLPDRYIIGKCPRCFSENQYGDLCEICGNLYNSIELINPRSIITNSNLIKKKTKHLFFNLPLFKNNLYKWINSINLQKPIFNKIINYISLGLNEINISRDSPYFGFKIPNYKKKYFYVWMDASIGYISTFINLCKFNNNINFEEYWNINSNAKIYQFIGKDIIYFHLLFWPAILDGLNIRKPNRIIVHGHLIINGNKMSKSKENYILAKNYIKYLESDYIRYYFSSKLSNNIEDINFNLLEFSNKINSEIINKILNLASRNSKLLDTYFNSILSNNIDFNIYTYFVDKFKTIFNYYKTFKYKNVINEVISLADIANKYISDNKPWYLVNNIKNKNKLHIICTTGINLFKVIITFLKPIIPKITLYSEDFLGTKLKKYNLKIPIKSFHRIKKFKIIFNKINIKNIDKIFNY